MDSVSALSSVNFKGIQSNDNNVYDRSSGISPAVSSDEFVKENPKSKTKKKSILFAGGVIALLSVAILGRKKIASVFSNIKAKVSKNGSDIASEVKDGTRQIANNVKRTFSPEEIKLPTNGVYDLTKEADEIALSFNNSYFGFSDYVIGKNGYTRFTGSLYDKISSNNLANAGITPDGKAYIKLDYNDLGLDLHKISDVIGSDIEKKALTTINLVSKDDKFTPVQKNLLALAQQKKGMSPNSPFLKTLVDDVKSSEDIYKAIEKWSQDIDINDEATQKMLGGLSKLKPNEASWIFNLGDESGRIIENIASHIK